MTLLIILEISLIFISLFLYNKLKYLENNKICANIIVGHINNFKYSDSGNLLTIQDKYKIIDYIENKIDINNITEITILSEIKRMIPNQ